MNKKQTPLARLQAELKLADGILRLLQKAHEHELKSLKQRDVRIIQALQLAKSEIEMLAANYKQLTSWQFLDKEINELKQPEQRDEEG